MIHSRRAIFLYSAFFLSGAAGLIYEITWLKALGLIFGSTVYAVTTVLAAFMGGLGLGSWALGSRLDRHPHPARAYAQLEAAIALTGPLTFALLPWLRELYFSAGGGVAIRFAASVLLLLVPTFLMGGTFPVMVRVFRSGEAETGKPVSRLYALNTAGAVAGTMMAGFVLLPQAGIVRTALLAAACNLLAAALAWSGAAAGREEPAPVVGNGLPGEPGLTLVLLVAFLTGATAMILEVAWTRLLAAPLGGSTYAFTVLLAAFLVGIAAGSRLFARVPGPNRAGLGLLQVGIALAGVLTLAVWRGVPEFVFVLLEHFGGSFFGVVVLQFAAAFMILLLPALLYGLSFPWLAALYAPGEARAGGRVGRLYAVNTLGAIAGAALAGFLLVPRLGSYGTLAVALALSGAAGIFLLQGWRRPAALAGLAALLLAGGAARLFRHSPFDQEAVMASYFHNPLYRSGLTLGEIAAAQDYVFLEDGLNASVAVVRAERYQALKINGKVDASSRDMKTQILAAALPLAMHPAPRKVLVVGFGSGVTTRVAAEWPGVERVDTVEIEPAVLRAAPYLKDLNAEVYRHARSRLIVDDARHFLFTTRETYDVIISEPSNPWMAGIGNLFTAEFYREARARLAGGGLLTQWVQAYQLLPEDLALVTRTMVAAFPQMSLWRGEAHDFLLVGAQAAAWPGSPGYRALFGNERGAVGAALRKLFRQELAIQRPEGLWAYLLLHGRDLVAFAGSGEINTDDRPVLEFRAPWRLLRPSDTPLPAAVTAARTQGLPVSLSPEERLAVAETMLRIGEVEPSRNLARPLLKEIPDAPGIWLYAGDLNRILHNPPVAESSYRRALERSGASKGDGGGPAPNGGAAARALAGLAMVAVEIGDSQAEARLRKALEAAGPSNEDYVMEVIFALAQLLARSNRLDEAITLEKRLLAMDPPFPYLPWALLGELYLRKDDGPAAQQAFDKSLSIDPYNYPAHRRLAEFYLNRGRAQEAAREYRFLLRYHPVRDPSLYERAAGAFRLAGSAGEAERTLAKARRVYPAVVPPAR